MEQHTNHIHPQDSHSAIRHLLSVRNEKIMEENDTVPKAHLHNNYYLYFNYAHCPLSRWLPIYISANAHVFVRGRWTIPRITSS